MNNTETVKILNRLAVSCSPAPEGDAFDLVCEVWADTFAAVSYDDMLAAVRTHITDTTPASDGRPRGGYWPTPADMLARMDGTDDDADAWAYVRGCFTGYVDQSSLTRSQRYALACLPDTFARRQMSGVELDKLKGRFLQLCRDYQPPAAPVVVAFPAPTDTRRLVEHVPDLDPQQAAAFNRRAFASVPRPAPTPCSDPPKHRNGQGGPKQVKHALLRTPVDEAELRARSKVAADVVRARLAAK